MLSFLQLPVSPEFYKYKVLKSAKMAEINTPVCFLECYLLSPSGFISLTLSFPQD